MAVRSAPDTEPAETARRGTEIYERDIKPTLDESQDGHYVSIDVDTGCWTIADTRRSSIDDLYERYPDARDVWMLRVGYQAVVSFGGRPPREDEPSPEVRADRVESNSEAATAPDRTQADRKVTGSRGEAIYERDIKPILADDQIGRIVAIDVDSGCWAIADDLLQASADLRAQHPDASDVWFRRVGYRAAFGFAGHPPREDDSSDEVSADRVQPNSEAMTAPVRTPADRAETRRRGEAIYERDIKPNLGDDQIGRIVAIDVDSSCWAIADDVLQASADLRAQRSEASDVWLLRVGYRALVSFGGQQPRPSA